MWIADGWKEYEVIDCSGGEKLERWGDYLLVRPDPQVIWNTKKENEGWKHPNGHYQAVADPLPGSDLSSKTVQFQTHRTVPGTGDKLGLVFRKNSLFQSPGQSTESVRLYRRRYIGGRKSRSTGHSRGRIKGYGILGKGERGGFRSFRRTDTLACGRLYEICGA